LWLTLPIITLAYALASIRWYFGLIVWLALALFLVLTALRTQHTVAFIAVAALLFAVLAQAVRLGGREDIPIGIRQVLDPRPRIAALCRPWRATQTIGAVRGGFENTPGATSIRPGPMLQPKPPASQPAPEKPESASQPAPSVDTPEHTSCH